MRKSLMLNRLTCVALTVVTLGGATAVCLGQESSTPQRLESRPTTCVPGMADYPAFQKTYGNPYRIMDCRNGECESTALERWKRSMQSSHWGYPEYFHRNSFGYANRNAFSSNIRDGAIERSTLYLMDFYPEDSPYAHMLTPKGLERLEKSICVSNAFASPLRIEKSAKQEVNDLRLQWLSEHPSVLAAGIASSSIQLISKPIGIQAIEGIYRYQKGLSAGSSLGSGGATSGTALPMLQGAGAGSGTPNIR